jgi:hypothetical protein
MNDMPLPTPHNIGTGNGIRIQAPAEIHWALRLLWASLAISVIQFLVFLPAAISVLPADPAGRRSMILGYAMTVAGFILGAFLNIKIAHKKNWARIGKLLLAALSLSFQVMFSPKLTALQYMSAGIVPALNFAALYLLFFTSGRLWFRQAS